MSYSTMKSYGGVKGRAVHAGTGKRSSAAKTALSNARANIQAQNRKMSTRYAAAQMAKETGYVDKASQTYACNTTGTIALLNTVPQGAGQSQRVGKRIRLKGCYFRGFGIAGTTTTLADTSLVLVYDKRPTGILPAVTDVLTAASAVGFTNDVNSDRFRILRRWDFKFVGNRTTAGQQTSESAQNFDEYVDLKGLPQVFGAAGTGAIGDITEGALYLVSVGNQAAGTTDPQFDIANRVRFWDV